MQKLLSNLFHVKLWHKQYFSLKLEFYSTFYKFLFFIAIAFVLPYFAESISNKATDVTILTAVNIFVSLLFLVLKKKKPKWTEEMWLFLGAFVYGCTLYAESLDVPGYSGVTGWHHGYTFALLHQLVLGHLINSYYILAFDVYTIIIRSLLIEWDTSFVYIFFIVFDLITMSGQYDKNKTERQIFKGLHQYMDECVKLKQFIRNQFPADILILNAKNKKLFSNSPYFEKKNNETELHHDTIDALASFILDRVIEGNEYVKYIPGPTPKTLNEVADLFITSGRRDIQVKLQVHTNSDENKKIFEVKLAWIKWDQERALALTFDDITHMETISILKSAEDNKDKVISNLSHEIRTPIVGMLGLFSIIEKLTDDPNICNYLNLCKKNCDFLLNVVNSMLDMQLLGVKKFKLNPADVNINQLFTHLKSLFEFHCQQRDIEFNIKYDAKLPSSIITDKNRLFQILVNLTGNAMKFVSKGSITVSARPCAKDNSRIEISVADTGIGIKEEDKKNLFTAFGKLKDSKKYNTQGVGLGLVISNELSKILNLNQEGIVFESEYGVGTTFSFTVAKNCMVRQQSFEELDSVVITVEDYSVDDKVTDHLTKYVHPSSLGHRRLTTGDERNPLMFHSMASEEAEEVLIVDDNPFNLMIIQHLLKGLGHTVVSAINGEEAVRKVEENFKKGIAFKAIFMDLEMPIMNGYEATAILKKMMQENLCYYIPIIGLSAHEREEEKQRCIKLGMDGFLTKPVEEKHLKPFLFSRLSYREQ